MSVAGKVVEWHQLFQVVYASLGAALGVTIAFSATVAGLTRFAEARRSGRGAAASAWAVLAALGLAVCATAIVLGIVVMTTKT
jgi:hypothetical protein